MHKCKCGLLFKSHGTFLTHSKYCSSNVSKLVRATVQKLYLKSNLYIYKISSKLCISNRVIKEILGDSIRSAKELQKLIYRNGRKFKQVRGKCNKCGLIVPNSGALVKHQKACNGTKNNGIKKNKIVKLYNEGKSIRELCKMGYNYYLIERVLKNKKRTMSEASKLAHKKFPLAFIRSKRQKENSRKCRLAYMKKNKNCTAWRLKNFSYPEKIFANLIRKNKLGIKFDIIREYPVFPFYIDFAFTNIKLAVEIDGSQHWKDKEVAKKDRRKNKLLIKFGWKVYRIPEFKLRTKEAFLKTEKEFIRYIKNLKRMPKIFDNRGSIITHEQVKAEKIKNRLLAKEQKIRNYKSAINEKLKAISKNGLKGFGSIMKLARKWKVSHTQVRRIIKRYKPNWIN